MALTLILMKCFTNWFTSTSRTTSQSAWTLTSLHWEPADPQDAISTVLYSVSTHLQENSTSITSLFANLSSAFNAISPFKLMGELSIFGLSATLDIVLRHKQWLECVEREKVYRQQPSAQQHLNFKRNLTKEGHGQDVNTSYIHRAFILCCAVWSTKELKEQWSNIREKKTPFLS